MIQPSQSACQAIPPAVEERVAARPDMLQQPRSVSLGITVCYVRLNDRLSGSFTLEQPRAKRV